MKLSEKQKRYIERLVDIKEEQGAHITRLSHENILSLRKLGRDHELLDTVAMTYAMDYVFQKRFAKTW